MNRERITNLFQTARTAVEIAAFLPLSAFTISTRKEVGSRDHWTCQGINGNGCSMTHLNSGEPLNWDSGFYVTAAHYPDKHHHTGKGYHDTDPDNGRILCLIDHAAEEVMRQNQRGARKLLGASDGIYHRTFVAETGLSQMKVYLEDVLEIMELNPELYLSHPESLE